MDKKIKILLILLGIVSLCAVGISVWIFLSAQAEVSEYAQRQIKFERENSYLQEKLDTSQKETHHWQEKSQAITEALNKLGKEHVFLQSQCDSLVKEKDALVEEKKKLSAELERLDKLYSQVEEKAKEVKPDKSDEFLTSLLEEKAGLQVEVENLRQQIIDMEGDVRPWQDEIAQLEKIKKKLEKKMAKAESVSDVLSTDLLQEKKKRTALEKNLAKTEEQLSKVVEEKDKLATELAKMRQALEQRLAELDKTKTVLRGAVEGAKKAVGKEELSAIQLSPIVVKAEEELSRTQVIEKETYELAGRIITVNDKYKFVVIDIGRDDGVEKGMCFDVYRNANKIGEVEVIEARQNIAACDIKEMDVRRLQVNDTVRY